MQSSSREASEHTESRTARDGLKREVDPVAARGNIEPKWSNPASETQIPGASRVMHRGSSLYALRLQDVAQRGLDLGMLEREARIEQPSRYHALAREQHVLRQLAERQLQREFRHAGNRRPVQHVS